MGNNLKMSIGHEPYNVRTRAFASSDYQLNQLNVCCTCALDPLNFSLL